MESIHEPFELLVVQTSHSMIRLNSLVQTFQTLNRLNHHVTCFAKPRAVMYYDGCVPLIILLAF